MEAQQQDDLWAELDALEVPKYGGRRLDAGGFVFADPFDTLLRHISEDYLRAAWDRLSSLLQRYALEVDDLSWGWFHGGETYITDLVQPAPSDFTGWTSLLLDRLDEDPRFGDMDEALKVGSPALRCGCTGRSRKWRIAPDDFPIALRLIEALWTYDPTDWWPGNVLQDHERILDLWHKASKAYQDGDLAERDRYHVKAQAAYTSPEYRMKDVERLSEPWRKIATALEEGDQQPLNSALAEARSAYSALGYRILVRGYTKYLLSAPGDAMLHLP